MGYGWVVVGCWNIYGTFADVEVEPEEKRIYIYIYVVWLSFPCN